MKKEIFYRLIPALAISTAILAGVWFIVATIKSTTESLKRQDTQQEQQLGHGGPLEMIPYPTAIGSVASPSTLATTTYNNVSSTLINVGGLPNFAFNVGYTPKSYGSRLFVLIERSFDGVNFYPYSTITPESNDVLVNTSGSSTTTGIPFVIPGNAIGTAASGTRITASFDLTVAASYIRVSAKESSTSTAGTANVEAYFTSN